MHCEKLRAVHVDVDAVHVVDLIVEQALEVPERIMRRVYRERESESGVAPESYFGPRRSDPHFRRRRCGKSSRARLTGHVAGCMSSRAKTHLARAFAVSARALQVNLNLLA